MEEYWQRVFELKNITETYLFPNLKVVISVLLVLPFANVSVERIFNDLKIIKTEHRNALNTDTISNILFTKQGIKDNGGLLKFEPTDTMVQQKAILWK